jgi:radical SAM superfamily enzyme YgiQ (UPF0313 family)
MNHNTYKEPKYTVIMVMKLQLHANVPHDIDKPNAALGYLKSFLSSENIHITNIYWYLMPPKIVDLISIILASLQSKYIHTSHLTPLFTAYISRFFYRTESEKREHVQPTLIDSLFSSYTSLERVENAAKMFKNFIDYSIEYDNMADVDIAGFTIKMYQWFISKYIWSVLKELNPNITIVVGGLNERSEAVAFLKAFKNVDCAIWGEGELPLRELIRHHGDSLHEVPRLVYRDRNTGEIRITDVPGEKVLMYPFADHSDYFEQLKKFDLTISPQIPVFSTRYCRWNRCKFCNLHKGGTYYERPAKDIVEEIEYQSKKYDTDRFLFPDSDIGRKKNEDFELLLKSLLESVVKRKIPYDITAEISPLKLRRTHMEMMSNIRISVQIGFEALTDSILKKIDKMHRFAENIQALKFGNDYEMVMGGLNVLRSLPGECEEDVIESIENMKFLRFFLRRYNLTLSELTLYKGAPYFEDIPPEEREKRWVTNFLYTEMNRLNLIKEEVRWNFFGFGTHNLVNHLLWDQFADLLDRFQSNKISYEWREFPDGSSLVEEHNAVSGDQMYLLDEEETRIMKFCDSITYIDELKHEFPHVDVEDIITQLRGEHLLYADERGRLISILSERALRNL